MEPGFAPPRVLSTTAIRAPCCSSVRGADSARVRVTCTTGAKMGVTEGVGVGELLAPRLKVVEGVREKLEEEELL